MKTIIHKFSPKVVFLGMILVTTNVVMAQTSSITTTTTSAGTVREFGPEALTITTESSPTPVRYTYSKTTSYVDENGNPVSVETVKSGLPVTVYYDRNGDRLVATRVVVNTDPNATVIEHKKTTTTTETNQ